MKSWQDILREEINHKDFQLIDDNDKFIIDGVMKSYKEKITATPEQVKEILDGAYKAGFRLAKRRYPSKTIFVLTKNHKNAFIVFQFSIQPNTLLVCDVCYNGVEPTAKKSKYFTTIYNKFDKTLPLYFMNTDVGQELQEQAYINISDEYNWSDYFDYMYSFMTYMLLKLNDEDAENYLEESLNEEIQEKEKTVFDIFIDELHNFDKTIQIEYSENKIKKEVVLYIKWDNDYKNQPDNVRESLNTIINDFLDSFDKSTTKTELSRARTNMFLARTIFVKYL